MLDLSRVVTNVGVSLGDIALVNDFLNGDQQLYEPELSEVKQKIYNKEPVEHGVEDKKDKYSIEEAIETFRIELEDVSSSMRASDGDNSIWSTVDSLKNKNEDDELEIEETYEEEIAEEETYEEEVDTVDEEDNEYEIEIEPEEDDDYIDEDELEQVSNNEESENKYIYEEDEDYTDVEDDKTENINEPTYNEDKELEDIIRERKARLEQHKKELLLLEEAEKELELKRKEILEKQNKIEERKYESEINEKRYKLESVIKQPVKENRSSNVDYSSLEIDVLYKEVKTFMVKNGVQQKPISLELLNNKFGSNNILRLLKRNYIIKIGKGVTIGL